MSRPCRGFAANPHSFFTILHRTAQFSSLRAIYFPAPFRRRVFLARKGPDRCPPLPPSFYDRLLPAAVVLACLVAATQWTAALLAYQPALGRRGSISSASSSTPPGSSSPGGWPSAPRRPASSPAPGRWQPSAASRPASSPRGSRLAGRSWVAVHNLWLGPLGGFSGRARGGAPLGQGHRARGSRWPLPAPRRPRARVGRGPDPLRQGRRPGRPHPHDLARLGRRSTTSRARTGSSPPAGARSSRTACCSTPPTRSRPASTRCSRCARASTRCAMCTTSPTS